MKNRSVELHNLYSHLVLLKYYNKEKICSTRSMHGGDEKFI